MYEEIEQKRACKQATKDQKWLKTDLCTLLDSQNAASLYSELITHNEVTLVTRDKPDAICSFPDFGATTLRGKGLDKLNQRLLENLRNSLQPLGRTPFSDLYTKQQAVWRRVVMATETFYTMDMLKRYLAKLTEEDIEAVDTKQDNDTNKNEIKSVDLILTEVGVKTGLSLVFSLLKQVWVQSSWQQQLHQSLISNGTLS